MKLARMVDEKGSAIILKDDVPRYILLDFDAFLQNKNADGDALNKVASRIMAKHIGAFEELAKW